MDKTEIKVSCVDQVLKITEAPVVASGGKNEICVVFSFCEKWDGFAKTAIFYRADEPVYYAVLDENDTCIVPWEVCYEEGTFNFGVFGDKGDTRRTALETKYKVKKGAITADTMPSDPTPEVYDQIMAVLAEIRDSQAGFISVAEKAVEDANTATQEAQTATANANQATVDANTASTRAYQAAENANASASNANTEAGNAMQATAKANEATTNANKATSDARAATEETNTARESLMETATEAFETIKELQGGEDAPAIVCSAEGEVISVNDSADRMLRGLNLYGKTEQVKTTGAQLINSAKAVSKEEKGITFTVNADKSVSAKGTATGSAYLRLDGDFSSGAVPIPDFLVVGNTYYLQDAVLCLYKADGQGATFNNGSFTMPSGYDYWGVFVYVPSGATVAKTYYPMLNAGNTAISWEPFTGGAPSPSPEYPQPLESVGESIAVKVCGKNLLPYPYADGSSTTHNGITYTVNADGSITANGTATATSNFNLHIAISPFQLKKGERYVYSGCPKGGSHTTYRIRLQDATYTQTENEIGDGVAFTAGHENYYAWIDIKAGTTANNLTFYPMIRIASTGAEYEPYKGQTLTASTPNGLPGIPVASGGNYTDENGQQWICDEVDFARGVYVQRVDVQVCNGSENWELYTNLPRRFAIRNTVRYANGRDSSSAGPVCLSNHFRGIPCDAAITDACWLQRKYLVITDIDNRFADATALKGWLAENPTTFMFPIATPIETPLSAEELAQYAALHSNKPNTTAFNDATAGMKMDYVADTKTYIDNKLAAISAAVLNA